MYECPYCDSRFKEWRDKCVNCGGPVKAVSRLAPYEGPSVPVDKGGAWVRFEPTGATMATTAFASATVWEPERLRVP